MEKLCCEEFRLLELPAPDVLDDPRAVQTIGAYSDKDPEEVIDQMRCCNLSLCACCPVVILGNMSALNQHFVRVIHLPCFLSGSRTTSKIAKMTSSSNIFTNKLQ